MIYHRNTPEIVTRLGWHHPISGAKDSIYRSSQAKHAPVPVDGKRTIISGGNFNDVSEEDNLSEKLTTAQTDVPIAKLVIAIHFTTED